jgi:Zn-dependent protease with chaperone function
MDKRAGHIKYGHTNALVYLLPFLGFPLLGTAFSWLAGFWQRRAELTADRLALMYMEDSELVKRALIKVHVGPDVSDSMNDTARQWLQYTAERPMNHLAQTFSSHPFLVRRLSHLDKWKSVVEPESPATS